MIETNQLKNFDPLYIYFNVQTAEIIQYLVVVAAVVRFKIRLDLDTIERSQFKNSVPLLISFT